LIKFVGVKYDAHIINIMKGDQFSSGFVEINPNSKIPALGMRRKRREDD
jgi:GST-like protein